MKSYDHRNANSQTRDGNFIFYFKNYSLFVHKMGEAYCIPCNGVLKYSWKKLFFLHIFSKENILWN